MNELKPEDVMRALECCKKGTLEECEKCPRQAIPSVTYEECMEDLISSALALLREKDAEIERLKTKLKGETDGKTDL